MKIIFQRIMDKLGVTNLITFNSLVPRHVNHSITTHLYAVYTISHGSTP